MASNHLYLVDGSSYIFRAYHRLPPLTNTRGEPVGAVYGFTTMLWKLVEELNRGESPTHLAVIFDASSKTFRNDLYDKYKAHRPPPPEDLVPQFPIIREAVRAFSVPCIEDLGLERIRIGGFQLGQLPPVEHQPRDRRALCRQPLQLVDVG